MAGKRLNFKNREIEDAEKRRKREMEGLSFSEIEEGRHAILYAIFGKNIQEVRAQGMPDYLKNDLKKGEVSVHVVADNSPDRGVYIFHKLVGPVYMVHKFRLTGEAPVSLALDIIERMVGVEKELIKARKEGIDEVTKRK